MTGVDVSPAAIDWATERSTSFSGVDFRVDDVLHLATCADADFDAVVDGHCLHCIIGPDRRRACGSGRHAVGTPTAIWSRPSAANPARRLLPSPGRRRFCQKGKPECPHGKY
jgi:Methyltransferase domain